MMKWIRKHALLLSLLASLAGLAAAPYLIPANPDSAIFRSGTLGAALILFSVFPLRRALEHINCRTLAVCACLGFLFAAALSLGSELFVYNGLLSGMGSMDMMNDNTAYMADFQPLSQQEMAAVEKVREILIANEKIDCTACRYCCDVCPQSIPIPELFADVNENRPFRDPDGVKKAASCIECGACEDACPQHLPIKKLVARIGLIYP